MTKPKGNARDKHVDMIVGANIRRCRMARGMSQEVLAAKLGLTFQQVQKYEKGTNSVASSRIPQLCGALRITLADLFAGAMVEGAGKAQGLPEIPEPIVKFALELATMEPDQVAKVRRIATMMAT